MKKIIIRRNVPAQPPLFTDTVPPLLQRIYATRGIKSSAELERGLTHLLPYQTLKNIDKAVAHLTEAIKEQQTILVIGDFDADGATSTALAVNALQTLGAKDVHFLVPNRFEYGYGLTPEIVAVALRSNPHLIITVDNGVSSHAGVTAAKAAGVKVLITDHHLPGTELPDADALVNPNQNDDHFPSKNLAGVGVIFYVMLALRSYLRERNWFNAQQIPEPNMAQFLDLVALGTVADLVPLDSNNRILVHQGLQRIRQGKARVGIKALLAIAGRSAEKLVAADLGYAVAPRLNAAGRLTDMSLGINCLLSDDLNLAREIANQLAVLNEERRLIERDMQQQAFVEIEKLKLFITSSFVQSTPSSSAKAEDPSLVQKKLPFGICLFAEEWHQGVIGLLASRVKEHLNRPTIIFALGNNADELKGSARSVPGLHIRDALSDIATQYPTLISRFGGHAMAAGLTIQRQDYEAFCHAFDQVTRRYLTLDDLYGKLQTDGALSAEEFRLDLADCLREAGPWGQGFPEPLFDGRFKLLQQWIVGGCHLKLTLGTENNEKTLEAIAFNIDLKAWPNQRLQYVHAVYRLDVNEYQGRRSLQLIIEALEPA